MEFSKRLKEIRKDRGLTQNDITNQLKCSINKYASWEQGRTEPNIQDIILLCRLFDITADYLLGLTEY